MLAATVKGSKKQTSDLKGLVGADPIGVWAKDGTLHMSLDTAFDEMAHTVVWAKEQAPELKTVLVSGDVYANGGANDVQGSGVRIGNSRLLCSSIGTTEHRYTHHCEQYDVYILLRCKFLYGNR